jgi:Fic family protein
MDGNGRMGRFSMNLMLVSGGINWTVIFLSKRDQYMKALELASTNESVLEFAKFIKSEIDHWQKKISH